MSPPALHADVYFVRSGPARTFQQAIESTMDKPYDQCDIRPHYGPNVPNEPILTTASPSLAAAPVVVQSPGCAQAVYSSIDAIMKDDDIQQPAPRNAVDAAAGTCYQLNCPNFKLDSAAKWLQPKTYMGVSDVKIQFTTPPKPCAP